MIVVLEQSNKYMKGVQDELQRMDWRGVLADVAANRYNNDFMLEAEKDPDVERMYEEMEREVLGHVPQNVEVNLPPVAKVSEIVTPSLM